MISGAIGSIRSIERSFPPVRSSSAFLRYSPQAASLLSASICKSGSVRECSRAVVWGDCILCYRRHGESIVIGQCAETAAKPLRRRRMAHMREGRVAPDRPSVAYDPQHRWGHYVIERGQGPCARDSRPSVAAPRSPRGRAALRGPRNGTCLAATVATARLHRAASRLHCVPAR
jgi:hypothetical protein